MPVTDPVGPPPSPDSPERVVNLAGTARAVSRVSQKQPQPEGPPLSPEYLLVQFRLADGLIISFQVPRIPAHSEKDKRVFFWKEQAITFDQLLTDLKMMAAVHELALYVDKNLKQASKYTTILPFTEVLP